MNKTLWESLSLYAPMLVAFTGGGGKTSLMWRLAKELKEKGESVVVATTTRIWPPGPVETDYLILQENEALLREQAEQAVAKGKIITVAPGIADGKLLPLKEDLLRKLLKKDSFVLVEADGAAELPFKAPAEHEPVVPSFAGMQVLVFGLDALGKPLTAQYCHRPERIAAISGASLGDAVTPQLAATVLASPSGGLKGKAPQSKLTVCLNKADGQEQIQMAQQVAELLLAKGISKVLATTAKQDPVVREMWEGRT